jgi:Condensation domain
MPKTTDRLANLSPAKRALLEQRLLKKSAGAPPIPGIRRRQTDDPSPLSFAQQRLWFLDQLEPGNSTYNAAIGLRLRGPLREDAVRAALQTIVARHEVLRTVYLAPDGNPFQKVLNDFQVELRAIDLRNLPEGAREAGAKILVTKEVRRPFNLTRDLMLRPTLLRIAETDHLLLLTTHHIASDGWSKGVIYSEFERLYNAALSGDPAALPDLPVQFADFALFQRRRLEGAELDKQVAFWTRHLSGAPQVLELQTDRPRPPVQTFRGEHLPVSFPGALYDGLKGLGRRAGTTPYMTLLAAFNALLAAYTRQENILVGSPMAGRNHVETEGLIGFFVNTLVLRTDLAGNPTFVELLGRVKEATLAAFAHQDLPFEKVVEALRPRRDPSRNPLFQVNFRVQTALTPPPRLAGLEVEHFDFDPRVSRFDFAAEFWATPDLFGGYFEYNTDLFEPETIRQMAANFETLLNAAVADPDIRLDGLKGFLMLDRRAPSTTGAQAGSSQVQIPRRRPVGPGGQPA